MSSFNRPPRPFGFPSYDAAAERASAAGYATAHRGDPSFAAFEPPAPPEPQIPTHSWLNLDLIPSWLKPFTLDANTRFTRTPDHFLRPREAESAPLTAPLPDISGRGWHFVLDAYDDERRHDERHPAVSGPAGHAALPADPWSASFEAAPTESRPEASPREASPREASPCETSPWEASIAQDSCAQEPPVEASPAEPDLQSAMEAEPSLLLAAGTSMDADAGQMFAPVSPPDLGAAPFADPDLLAEASALLELAADTAAVPDAAADVLSPEALAAGDDAAPLPEAVLATADAFPLPAEAEAVLPPHFRALARLLVLGRDAAPPVPAVEQDLAPSEPEAIEAAPAPADVPDAAQGAGDAGSILAAALEGEALPAMDLEPHPESSPSATGALEPVPGLMAEVQPDLATDLTPPAPDEVAGFGAMADAMFDAAPDASWGIDAGHNGVMSGDEEAAAVALSWESAGEQGLDVVAPEGGLLPPGDPEGPAASEDAWAAVAVLQDDGADAPDAGGEPADAAALLACEALSGQAPKFVAYEPVQETLGEALGEALQEAEQEPAHEPADEAAHEPLHVMGEEMGEEVLHEAGREPAHEPLHEAGGEVDREVVQEPLSAIPADADVPAALAIEATPAGAAAAELPPTSEDSLSQAAHGVAPLRAPEPVATMWRPYQQSISAHFLGAVAPLSAFGVPQDPAPAAAAGAHTPAPVQPAAPPTPALDADPAHDLPPLDLLREPPVLEPDFELSEEFLDQSSAMLQQVLRDFGVRGEVIDANPGPVVTLYEFEPAPGVKSSRVIGLSPDIARSMSAVSARVAVVEGRNVIGIELPNRRRETVWLRELLASHQFVEARPKLGLSLGKTIGGEPVIVDLARMPHLLVAGTTGSGKSVAINTMILSLLYRHTPQTCRLIMIDPKMLELSIYEGIPHLLTPVVTDPKKAIIALKWAVKEMEERYRKMSRLAVRNIDGYNARVKEAAEKGEIITRAVQVGFDKETGESLFEEQEMDLAPLPYIVVIVDEMADLMMVAGKEIEGAIQRLAQMARAAGIHLVMATQRPSVDVITGTIKANFPTRISFQVTSKIDSRTILGEMGAETLLGQGDMLFMAGGGRIMRVHGPFVSDAEVEHVVAFLKAQGGPDYLDAVVLDEDAEADDEEDAVFDRSSMADAGGDLYEQAVAIVMRDRKASTSYIQRRLQVGYNKAASLMERMETEGIVGPANHAGKREILTFSRPG